MPAIHGADGRFVKQGVLDRLFDYIEFASDGCWLWRGSIRRSYGRSTDERGETHPVHRIVYELVVGDIDPALQLDHLCRIRVCVNPDHLEPVTQATNMARSSIAALGKCRNGHDLAGSGTYKNKYPDGRLRIRCRVCMRASMDRNVKQW